MTKIIILSGKAQSGKDTAYKAIKEYAIHKKLKCCGYSFAFFLKKICCTIFGLTNDQCWGSDFDKNTNTEIKWKDLPITNGHLGRLMVEINPSSSTEDFLSAREFLQVFGTNICRKIYPDCWVLSIRNTIIKDNPDIAVITDARFPNEIEYFANQEPLIIRLLRNTTHRFHSSEILLDNFNFLKFKHYYDIDNTDLSLAEKNKLVLDIVDRYINI